jgi:hypothetical protein
MWFGVPKNEKDPDASKTQMNIAPLELNFECNDRRNKIIPNEVQAKHQRASRTELN